MFPITPRSILEDLGSGDAGKKARARDRLAEQYWSPIYNYLRRRWQAAPDLAAEVTQELFLRDLERETFRRFDPERARFRTFLRTCADNLLRDHARRDSVRARAANTLALAGYERELADHAAALSPEEVFERTWRSRVVAIARARLDANLKSRGKDMHAAIFTMFYDEDPPPSYGEAASRLSISVTDVTNWLHVARREWRTQFALVLHEGAINSEDLATELAANTSAQSATDQSGRSE